MNRPINSTQTSHKRPHHSPGAGWASVRPILVWYRPDGKLPVAPLGAYGSRSPFGVRGAGEAKCWSATAGHTPDDVTDPRPRRAWHRTKTSPTTADAPAKRHAMEKA